MTDSQNTPPSSAPKKRRDDLTPDKKKTQTGPSVPKAPPVTTDDIRRVTEQFQKQMDFNRDAIRRTQKNVIATTTASILAVIIACGVAGYLILGSAFFHDAEKARQVALAKIYEQYETVKVQQQELLSRQAAIESTVAQVRDRAGAMMRGDIDLVAELRNIQNLSAGLSTVNARIDALSKTQGGMDFLGSSAQELQGMVLGMQGRMGNLEQALEQAKAENSELADMLEGVNGNQLKAAAMLIAANQLRTTMRQGGNYETDLATVRALAGDDPELQVALAQLEPYARDGVMSTQTLRNELQSLAGEIIMAGIQGENLSVQERFKNRLQNIVSIKRQDGQVHGNGTQAAVARAEILMNQGDIEGAIAELQTLQGGSAQVAQPWIEEATARLMATQTSSRLAQDLINRLTGGGVQPSNLGFQPAR